MDLYIKRGKETISLNQNCYLTNKILKYRPESVGDGEKSVVVH